MIPARDAYVFRKANVLARRMCIEPDKKQAAHLVCERLLALLNLGRNNGHLRHRK